MNILVYPHELAMGGSQINAIELAAAVRDKGHKVTIASPDGVLSSLIRRLDLDFVAIPRSPYYPSLTTAYELSVLARKIKADVVHSYEWRPAIECAVGPHLFGGVRMLATVLSMDISHLFPRHVPLIVGTRELATKRPAQKTWVLEPPIDSDRNRATDVTAARTSLGFKCNEIVLSVVCRLTTDLAKLEGVLQAIEVVGRLADKLPLRLIVVGDGIGKAEVDAAAATVNTRQGREVVIVTGQLLDPGLVYEASDIVLGMGSSALKGMAFAKPLVVQGTDGFWTLFDERTKDLFLYQGFFGHHGEGARALEAIIERLAGDESERERLGRLGRSLIEGHFSLERMTDKLIDIYQITATDRQLLPQRLTSTARTLLDVAKFRAVMSWRSSRSAVRGAAS